MRIVFEDVGLQAAGKPAFLYEYGSSLDTEGGSVPQPGDTVVIPKGEERALYRVIHRRWQPPGSLSGIVPHHASVYITVEKIGPWPPKREEEVE